MKGRLKVRVAFERGAFLRAFLANEEPIARAATAAVAEAGNEVKVAARGQIASAGFSRRWQNALRVDHYPRGGDPSIDAAAHVYHKIHYAWVFDEGATIAGAPFLWIPLSHAPSKIGRFRMTPRRYPGPLQFVRRAGKAPLLVAQLGMSAGRARSRKLGKVSLAAARKGAAGGGKNRVIRNVPMFVGISSVRLRKRFRITEIVRRAGARLGELYFKHLKVNG
jgi:Family of unknown function (DUF6441)